jgi:hypothetical protein
LREENPADSAGDIAGILPASAATASEEFPQKPSAAQNATTLGSPAGSSICAKVGKVSTTNKIKYDGPDDGFQKSDYPNHSLLCANIITTSIHEDVGISSHQVSPETEDGFRHSDYPIRPLIWREPVPTKLDNSLKQHIKRQQVKKNRTERESHRNSSLRNVYTVEASEVEAVIVGQAG